MRYIENSFKRSLKAFKQFRFRNFNFAVVSNNCWGGEIYKTYAKEFNTPFIGLFIMPSDYIKLLENFNFYMNKKLVFIEKKNFEYPIGRLDDIEIYFMHYKNQTEANEKWERRKERFLDFYNKYPEKVFFKLCDRDEANATMFKRFHETEHRNKISFSTGGFVVEADNNIIIRERDGNSVPDGKKLFYISLKYFDLNKWIKKGKLKKYYS